LERALVFALRLRVQFGDALAARGGPRAEPDRELTTEDEGGDGERREELTLDEIRALTGRQKPEGGLEQLAQEMSRVGGDAHEESRHDPDAPATAIDDRAEEPE